MCVTVQRRLCNNPSRKFLISVPIAFMMFLYLALYSNIGRRVTLKLNFNPTHFYVESYEPRNNHIDIAGYFYDQVNNATDTRKSFLSLLGIENLINKFGSTNRKVLSDESVFEFGRTEENVNCNELFKGNYNDIENTTNLLDNATEIESIEYIRMASDCANFTLKRNYILESLTEEERDFPIAFSILMYTGVEQFERLLRAIYRPQNSYCIHVDLGSKDDVFKAVLAIAACFPNVYMAQHRSLVKWGEMSVLQPEIVCLKVLYEKNKLWKYFINLTGQEFPLKTNYELVKILKAYNGANDVEGTRLRANKDRWDGKGDPPHGIIPSKGAVHAILCRGFVEYVVTNPKARDFLKWLERTYIPDETFFSSLNSNPHLKVPGSFTGVLETNNSSKSYLARYKIWRGGTCGGKHLRNICIFGVKDLQVLANRKELFANKFMWDYQRVTYGCMEELLYNRTRDEYFGRIDFDAGWYGTQEFVKNKI